MPDPKPPGRPRDANLTELVRAALAADPTISAPQLRAALAARGRSIGLRFAQALLERERGPAAAARRPAPTGERVWLPADVAADVARQSLPGEDVTATTLRLLRAACAPAWP